MTTAPQTSEYPALTPPAGEVRRAAFTELDPVTAYRLWQLRSAVFVLEQECPYLDLDGRDLEPSAVHLWVEDAAAVPAGVLRVLEDGAAARIGRVVVAPEARSSGVAARLMEAALAVVGERPSVLHAQARLEGWYARFGYAAEGPAFMEDGIAHVPMRRG